MKLQEKYDIALAYWQQQRPHTETELHWQNPYQLLVAVMLSAQCTDKRINQVTPALFAAFPTPEVMAAASRDEVFEYIRSVSYPNSKADHLHAMARMLVDKFDGEVPEDYEALQTLPGVGRKTANVVTAVAFHQPRIAVDTHVFRVSERIGFTTNSKNPLQTELELLKHIPEALRLDAHHWILLHGRYVCTARQPHCNECALTTICRYYSKHPLSVPASKRTARKVSAN